MTLYLFDVGLGLQTTTLWTDGTGGWRGPYLQNDFSAQRGQEVGRALSNYVTILATSSAIPRAVLNHGHLPVHLSFPTFQLPPELHCHFLH
jgi:hypothetical protein